MTIEELIARVLFARNIAHISHWQATGVGSYARHAALDEFYTNVLSALDTLVEGYQGKFGIIGNIGEPATAADEIDEIIQEDIAWIEGNRSLCKGITALENLLDGISDVYLKASYKLTNLE